MSVCFPFHKQIRYVVNFQIILSHYLVNYILTWDIKLEETFPSKKKKKKRNRKRVHIMALQFRFLNIFFSLSDNNYFVINC